MDLKTRNMPEKSPATACVGTAGWPKEDVYNKQFFFFNVYLNF